jgi:hypothetical protein
MSNVLRKEIPNLLITVTGLVMLLSFFLQIDVLTSWKGALSAWTVIIASVSVWLGLFYMGYAQLMNYRRKKTTGNLIYLVVPLVFFAMFFGTALIFAGGINSAQYQWLYYHIYQNVGATIYAIMFFTLASSAYRTMKLESLDAAALMFGGLIYTLRQIPIFQAWAPWIVDFGEWVLLVPNTAGGRGAVIAAALAAIVVGIRTLMIKERTTTEVS